MVSLCRLRVLVVVSCQCGKNGKFGNGRFDGKRPASLRYQCQVLSNKRRSEARVNIGTAFANWSQLKEFQGLKSHAKVATFLLDW